MNTTTTDSTTTTAQHTPGHSPLPWVYWSPVAVIIPEADTEAVMMHEVQGAFDEATGDGGTLGYFHRKEDAALCIASPYLLAALQKISANAAESPEWIRRVAQEAIQRATT